MFGSTRRGRIILTEEPADEDVRLPVWSGAVSVPLELRAFVPEVCGGDVDPILAFAVEFVRRPGVVFAAALDGSEDDPPFTDSELS